MTRATGSLFRRVGLLIEVASLFLLLSVARGNVSFWKETGIDPSIVLTAGVAIGFLLWLRGTMAMYWPKKSGGGEEEGLS